MNVLIYSFRTQIFGPKTTVRRGVWSPPLFSILPPFWVSHPFILDRHPPPLIRTNFFTGDIPEEYYSGLQNTHNYYKGQWFDTGNAKQNQFFQLCGIKIRLGYKNNDKRYTYMGIPPLYFQSPPFWVSHPLKIKMSDSPPFSIFGDVPSPP